MSAVAAPFLEERASSVCGSGIYGELVPFLVPYAPAQAFCSAVFPVKCTTKAVKRAPATTTKSSTTKTTTTKTTVTKSTTSLNPTSSAWSKCQAQPLDVISTLCSCIEAPKACSTTTTTTTTEPTTTTTTTITSASAPTPRCNGNTVTANGVAFCQFFAGYGVRNSYRFYTAQIYPSISDGEAIQRCADYVSTLGGVAQTFQIFYVPAENTWHCDSSLQSNCDPTFTPNTYVNQMYQYNVVGSTCST